MNWILKIGFILLIGGGENYLETNYNEKYVNKIGLIQIALSSPLPVRGPPQHINPFILHWEPANFERIALEEAHRNHLNRRKRDINSQNYGPVNKIKLKFFAHDREFRLVLHQNPLSVFAPDVVLENSQGPVDYDVSRVYTGSLEDDENSHVQAVLTSDNLIDGNIHTKSEQYYIEPLNRYSKDLYDKSGIHSIIYKLSDVKIKKSPFINSYDDNNYSNWVPSTSEHCASEKLRKKLLYRNDFKRRKKFKTNISGISNNSNNKNNSKVNINNNQISNKNINEKFYYQQNLKDNQDDVSMSHNRRKRWLPDEVTTNRDPPLPLDLDVPYNDDYSLFEHSFSRDEINRRPSISFSPPEQRDNIIGRNRGGLENSYDLNIRNRNILSNQYDANYHQTTNRNIIGNTYHENLGNSNTKFRTNFSNSNFSNVGNIGNMGSRPIHKTHVEIITKNGATKKPNIIVNNYNPDVIVQPPMSNNHFLNRHNDFMDSTTHSNLNSAKSLYDRKSTCMLYLQADHTFFQKMGSDEASIEAITRHVQRANSIYKNTDFNADGKPDNITFMIKRIKVHNMNALKDSTYRFPGNYGVEKFLELFSEEDYDAFCLAYMFTYRDFEMGTLGLAWTGDLKNAGGVCEKNGHYRGSLKSLNTGIVTLLNYGKHVPPAVSHVTLAHEIGHNFGSPHDPEQCTPGGEDGNYIMFARATSGDKRNNNKFSPCSLKSIEPVLNAKARSSKGCFTEPQTSICGNGVVEPGEQCDCGWEEDCKDDCCFPMSRHPRMDEKPCTLQPRAMCSPSQGPCCTNQCSLKFGDKCRDDNGCRDPSFCDGRMPQCPPSVNKPNKTICNKEFVCYMGECTGSICLAYGLESCQCLPGPNDPKTKSCELCCKMPGEGTPCKSSFEWNEPPYDVPDMFAKPGTPCNDYNGYCDVFQKCREVDPSGPLATLRKLLLSEESIASFKKWMQSNWYTVVLAVIGVIVLLVLSTKLLGKRNVKLKSVTIIHSATTETVRLPEDNNGVIVHTAVRTKVPFKKKVRGQRTHTKQISASKTIPALNSKQKSTPQNVSCSNNKGNAVVTPKPVSNKRSSDLLLKKVSRTKKNRVSAPIIGLNSDEVTVTTKLKDIKKQSKKNNKKHKEIIDYSKNDQNNGHTNTFGKVQKWLLDSPIVAQPLSHIEHTSKIQKVISKSQSTPERLTHKSQQKSKSVGNLASEKVKLQVVYKPPFKFSLKLSKNPTVKTHVIGGGKSKRKSRTGPDKKRVGPGHQSERNNRRTAILVRTDDENQDINLLEEHNYETLNPKSNDTSPLYENMQFPVNDVPASSNLESNNTSSQNEPASINTDTFRITRSASNSNIHRTNSKSLNYSRSNSVSHKPISTKPLSNKNSENSINLSRNFGSTQNLLQNNNNNNNNLAKSKKRNSLNLKNSTNINNFDTKKSNGHPKRSNSNLNLKRENSTTNLRRLDGTSTTNLLKLSSQSINRLGNVIDGCTSSSAAVVNSISNIPRASLSNHPILMNNVGAAINNGKQITPPNSIGNNKALMRQQSLNQSSINNNNNNNNNLVNNISPRPNTAGICDDRKFEWPLLTSSKSGQSISSATNQLTTNNINNFISTDQLTNRNLLNIKSADNVLDTDLEVMVSDIENLVS